MKSGIYALYWWEQDLVYIGLSQTINNRFAEHLRLMSRQTHTNYKIQNAYNKYGLPSLVILERCPINVLADREIYWCKEFNALGKNGLCLVEPGIVGFGADSNSSKYTKIQILRVFSLLYKGKHSMPSIEKLTGVRRSTVSDICSSASHLWIKEQYPEKYKLMTSIARKRLVEDIKQLRAIVKAPDGRLIEVYSLSKFCIKEFGDVNNKKHMGSVLTGTRKSHKGYTLYCSV